MTLHGCEGSAGGVGTSSGASAVRHKTASGREGSQTVTFTVSQSVMDPPRAHPSIDSQSGSAALDQTQVPSTRTRGLLNCLLHSPRFTSRLKLEG